MSWSGRSLPFTVHALLDEHGGDKEIRHQALWDELEARARVALREIAGDPQYADIRAEVWD